jgi:hypothetical protein
VCSALSFIRVAEPYAGSGPTAVDGSSSLTRE